jgi:hypothetical protein
MLLIFSEKLPPDHLLERWRKLQKQLPTEAVGSLVTGAARQPVEK